ncbi:MAG: glycosyltransferase [Aquificaceae bacterium]
MHSVLNQTYKDVEIIIVDDFSTDNSKEIVFNEFGNLIGAVRI